MWGDFCTFEESLFATEEPLLRPLSCETGMKSAPLYLIKGRKEGSKEGKKADQFSDRDAV